MPDNNSLPLAVSHNKITGSVTTESLHALTFFILGDVKSDHNPTAATTPWGWVSPRGTGQTNSLALPNNAVTYGNQVLSTHNIEASFAGLEVRHRDGRYLVNHGRISYTRTWDFCSSSDPQKQALGVRSLFDIIRVTPKKNFERREETIRGHRASDGLGSIYIPDHHYIADIFPEKAPLYNFLAGGILGDKDGELELEYLQGSTLFQRTDAIRDFLGEIHSRGLATMMRDTGYTIHQSRDYIDSFARARFDRIKNTPVPAGAPKPTFDTVRAEYVSALNAFKTSVATTGHIQNDINAIKAYIADKKKCPEGTVTAEVASQMLQEYEAISSRLTALRNNPDLAKKAYFKNLHLDSDTITPDMLLRLHAFPETRNVFSNALGDGRPNTGWLFMNSFSGFNPNTLQTLMAHDGGTRASELARSLRCMGSNHTYLFEQGIFNPDALGDLRTAEQERMGDMRNASRLGMIDLPGMIRTLLVPQAATLPEHGAYMATMYRAQFIDPKTNTMRRRVAMQRLATAFDVSSDIVHIDHIKKVCEELKKDTYSSALRDYGITQSDYNEIRGLLTAGVPPQHIAQQFSTLETGLTELIKKVGRNQGTVLSRHEFIMATAAIDIDVTKIKKDDGTEGIGNINFYALDGSGNRDFHVPMSSQQSANAHAAALRLAQRAKRFQEVLEPFSQQLALNPAIPDRRILGNPQPSYALAAPGALSELSLQQNPLSQIFSIGPDRAPMRPELPTAAFQHLIQQSTLLALRAF